MVLRGYPPLPYINHGYVVEFGTDALLQEHTAGVLKGVGKQDIIGYSSTMKRDVSPVQTILEMAGQLYCGGYPVDLTRVNADATDTAEIKPLCDLPAYQFNHDTAYWHESRISRNHRLRGYGRLAVLGAREPCDNPIDLRWRNIMRREEIPWVQDHKVSDFTPEKQQVINSRQINGATVYPAAGMLVMGIEAAKQTAAGDRIVMGLNIRDAVFYSVLPMPKDASGTEVNVAEGEFWSFRI